MEKMLKILSSLYGNGGRTIIIISIVIVCIVCILFKGQYLNITLIIKNYVRQFIQNGKYDKIALFISLGIPALLAIATNLGESGNGELEKNLVNGLTLIITVLTALFFSVLGLVIDLKTRIADSNKNATEKKRLRDLCQSVFETDVFEILVCIILLLLCFIYALGILQTEITRFFIYYFAYTLLINIFMLVKRLYVLINGLLK